MTPLPVMICRQSREQRPHLLFVSYHTGALFLPHTLKACYFGSQLHKLQTPHLCGDDESRKEIITVRVVVTCWWDGRACFTVVTYSNYVSVSQNVCHCFTVYSLTQPGFDPHTHPLSQNAAEYQSDVYWKQPVRSLQRAVCVWWGSVGPPGDERCVAPAQLCCGSIVMQRWVTSDSPPLHSTMGNTDRHEACKKIKGPRHKIQRPVGLMTGTFHEG